MAARRAVAEPAVEAYLAVVAGHLTGPRRAHAAVLDELRDGLLTAAETRRGHRHGDPVAAALAEFGPPDVLAGLFAEELACTRARGIGRNYLLTGPAVGLAWLLLLAPPGWWRQGPSALVTYLPALPLVAASAVVGLLLLVSGRLAIAGRDLLDLAGLLAVLCMVADAATIAAWWGAAATGAPGPLVIVAVVASLARLAGSGVALHRSRVAAGHRRLSR